MTNELTYRYIDAVYNKILQIIDHDITSILKNYDHIDPENLKILTSIVKTIEESIVPD